LRFRFSHAISEKPTGRHAIAAGQIFVSAEFAASEVPFADASHTAADADGELAASAHRLY